MSEMREEIKGGKFHFPCTGMTRTDGFSDFLSRELCEPRRNIIMFGEELSARFDAREITLVNSGSSANLAAAHALAEACGSERGAEAIVSGFTFPTTVASLLHAGFDVRVADTEPDGFCMDVSALRSAVNEKTRVVCVTHFLGFPARLQEIRSIADGKEILLLQDACETMDLRVGGKPGHAYGDLTTWSFYHPHHLSAFGGGAVVCADETWRRRVESFAHWGRECACHYNEDACRAPQGMNHYFQYVREGFNFEMSELNACFGRFQLLTWDAQEDARKRHYEILYGALKDVDGARVYAAPEHSGSPFVFPVTVLRCGVPSLAARLARRGVETRSLMGGAITKQTAFRRLHHEGLAHCVSLAERSFFTGIHQTLSDGNVLSAAEILREELQR